MEHLPVYLDCNASTPVEEEVIDAITHYMRVEYGNAESRTHRFGSAAAQAVKRAREQVAAAIDTDWDNVVFTSGATESNNLAILGLARAATALGKRHVISTQIEHKAVLEPLNELTKHGVDVTLVRPGPTGAIDATAVEAALRPDTFLVSVMHANNETGVIQPLKEIGEALLGHSAVFHTDAAQGFGKEPVELGSARLDMISLSGHKIFGPKGVGAIVIRPSIRTERIRPILFGGGQERGLRPGTTPVPLVVGLGIATAAAQRDYRSRREYCLAFRRDLLNAFAPLDPVFHGSGSRALPHVLNISFRGLDADAVVIALRDLVAISTGSACTSATYEPSHVLSAMGLCEEMKNSATRWSWCHKTPRPDWPRITERIRQLY